MVIVRALILAVVVAAVGLAPRAASAQPGASAIAAEPSTSDVLRNGNAAALAGDWAQLAALVEPLFGKSLAAADLAEAHRLAGIAAFFLQRRDDAERHFLGFLRIDLDGRLDPALYPPEVVAFCNDVASRHAAELRALRAPPPQRTWLLNLLPPLGQLQNGDTGKAIALGATLGAFVVINVVTYSALSSWCTQTNGQVGDALVCNHGGDHTRAANRLRPINIASGVAAILTYAYGVYDGARGYHQRSRELAAQPYVTTASGSRGGAVVGLSGSF